jgi:hypothetical protein
MSWSKNTAFKKSYYFILPKNNYTFSISSTNTTLFNKTTCTFYMADLANGVNNISWPIDGQQINL